MSYDIRKSVEIPGIDISGQTIVMPLELPMYEGTVSGLGEQAIRDLTSFLRHHAACEVIENNFDTRDEAIFDLYQAERGQMTAKLIAVFMALTGCAEELDIDLMQEIWEMPWEV